jgi:hypothetical protein
LLEEFPIAIFDAFLKIEGIEGEIKGEREEERALARQCSRISRSRRGSRVSFLDVFISSYK